MSADQPYAACNDCPETFTDRDAMRAHQTATLTPTGEAGVTARSHGSRVVNPTPQEREANQIRREIDHVVEDAIEQAMEELDRKVCSGILTEEQVTDALRSYPDFEEAWQEWNE